ncbi:uncharacterized protein LOC116005845 [Ipomoea triloba]|uniref:uncharacterized protein LOC116005845 n=1 Tax=Ipomoea triloba TaxID=35885 RepID=UPI00125CDF2A|nr:uncharacterized protein LOC116005845 [Ipomoea triloba]
MKQLIGSTLIGRKRKHPSHNKGGNLIKSSIRDANNSKHILSVNKDKCSQPVEFENFPLSDVTNVQQSKGNYSQRLYDSSFSGVTSTLQGQTFITPTAKKSSAFTKDIDTQDMEFVRLPLSDVTNVQKAKRDYRQVLNMTTCENMWNRGTVKYNDIGDPTNICEHCNAMFWYEEQINKKLRNGKIKYSTCCGHGKIKLPKALLPPKRILDLFFFGGDKRNEFLKNIRKYNNIFSFTSLGAKVDKSINNGTCPPMFRINGQNFHLMGGLTPEEGNPPKFAQLYIHDTENEVENRINSFGSSKFNAKLHVDIVEAIKQDLDDHNVLVKSFRLAKAQMQTNPNIEYKMRLIGKRVGDARTYNLPIASEVAALVVGDLDPSLGHRDILVETKAGALKRINELNPAYLPLQYPILFPYGEDGYREDIQFNITKNEGSGGRVRVSQREFFAYKIHDRFNEVSTMLYAKRLFQQFLVDAYTMVESSRLLYIRNNQKALRCEAYKGLSDALTRGEVDTSNQGKRIILPSSFTCGARYMIQNYQDAMAICRHKGYPNLFITFTCNPKWPEIQRYMKKCNLNAEDRPDIVCRVFQMKLDSLVKEIRTGNLFGVVTAVVYTIEFQKRGLPHAHILIFLERTTTLSTASCMDSFISTEIPDKEVDKEYYNAVEEFMIHGPCGLYKPNSPCMVNKKCSKHFPKIFVGVSSWDDDGYPIYRRRDNGRTVLKNGVQLDSRYVVPHNRYLLLKYKAHINVEWCNQSRSIKYLFKYVNKGNDRVTAEFYRSTTADGSTDAVDEISMYYDCRYISDYQHAKLHGDYLASMCISDTLLLKD